jgi:hypothetical protein
MGGVVRDPGAQDGDLHSALEHRFVEVVPAPLAVSRSTWKRVAGKIHCHPRSRPALGYLRASAVGSATPRGLAREVALVLRADALEVAHQIRLDGGGQHRDPVLLALGVPHGDLVGREVDVLHAQPAALEPAEPGPVE